MTVVTTNANGRQELKVARDVATYLGGVAIYYFKRIRFERLYSHISYLGQSVGFFYSPNLRAYLNEATKNFDIVHLHDIFCFPALVASSIAYREHKPYIVHAHGMLNDYSFGRRRLKKNIYLKSFGNGILSRASSIIAFTESERKSISRISKNATIATIPNGTNFPSNGKFLEVNGSDVHELDDKLVVLFLGRLHPGKGLDLLVKAFSKAASENKNAILLIAGPDEIGYKTELSGLAKELDLGDKVRFIDALAGEEKDFVMKRANLFALCSYSEGFPISVLEALSYGLPVVITKTCNFEDVEKYRAGYVTTCNVESIAQKLGVLLSDSELRKEMGHNGIRLIKEKYTWDIISNKTLALYDTVLERSS